MTKAEIIAETRNAVEKVLKAQVKNALSDTEQAAADAKTKELLNHRNIDTRRMKFEAWRHNSMYSSEVYKTVAKSIDV